MCKGLKVVCRRELFAVDTFTALTVEWIGHRFSFTHERGRRKNDIPFHIAKEFGGKS